MAQHSASPEPAEVAGNGRGQGAGRVYRALREDILRMNLAPGAPLDEIGIARQFGLSRSPVREALIRLASEGLVRTLPNKSTTVAQLEIEQFAAYTDALDLTQRVTTRLAAELRSAAELAEIERCQRVFAAATVAGDVLEMIDANRSFHLAISAAAQNRYLYGFHARLLDEGRRFLRLYFRSFNDTLPEPFAGEHDEIIHAIAARDAERAERLAHAHTMQFADRFLGYLARRRTGAIAVTPPR